MACNMERTKNKPKKKKATMFLIIGRAISILPATSLIMWCRLAPIMLIIVGVSCRLA